MNILQSTRNNTPNAVTCCNLLSGALACVAAFHAFEPWWWGLQGYQVAFVLIALAAVFDFFDGFTARLLHAVSPLGKELDSLSDAVSFGLAPGMVLYNMLVQYEPESGVAYIAMLIPVFGALRLAKFNVSTDQSTTFTGLPIPANAIFWIGFISWYADNLYLNQWIVALLVVVISLLMVSNIPMFSLKVKNLKFKENYKVYFLILAFILFVSTSHLSGLSWTIIYYVLASMLVKD